MSKHHGWCALRDRDHEGDCEAVAENVVIHHEPRPGTLLASSHAPAGLDVEMLAEAIAAHDLNIDPDDEEQRKAWRETPAQLRQAESIAAEYDRLRAATRPAEDAG
jgi:hypothetical protein